MPKPRSSCNGFEPQPGENTTTVQFFYSREPLLEKITSATTIVTFTYNADRRDIRRAALQQKSALQVSGYKGVRQVE